ncbi:E3 ubiquitin-protein ligase RNF123-like isoform X2 [Tympanuchus pallidicinctus]|uniref:E3 ubiquitin-protein ligase RNF123-like isoform X2 n=1 Tax=Tympanuchus pallidicinctus TaxID=109042 RepID=UPI002286D86B|nr:E3 ubiquitin-protein ligase RNF123-like isoform X2 [Tympanuchus pallidicinctus]
MALRGSCWLMMTYLGSLRGECRHINCLLDHKTVALVELARAVAFQLLLSSSKQCVLVLVVEGLQVQILKLLLNNKDRGGGEASRYIFLNKFRKFLQENASNRGNLTVLCPPEYMVCFLHRLIAALRFFWDGHKAKAPAALSSEGKAWRRS